MKAGEQPKRLERGMVLVAPGGALAGERLTYTGTTMGSAEFRDANWRLVRIHESWPWPGWVLAEDWP